MGDISSEALCSRISYRSTPDGEHRYRLVPLRPISRAAKRSLVYSSEVAKSVRRNSPGRLQAGFGAPPRRTSFTKIARARVKNGCAILDKFFGRKVGFLTGTLPGDSSIQLEALSSWSGFLIKKLKEKLSSSFPGSRVVYVWEWQKRGALHLHIAVGHNSSEVLSKLGCQWRRIWCSLLEKVSTKSGVNLFLSKDGFDYKASQLQVRTDAQFVTKSVGAYLSKYLSKGAGEATTAAFHCPSRWWGIDNWTRFQITAATVWRCSKIYPYTKALEIFRNLITEVSLHAVQFFWWKNKVDPAARTFICWLPSPG